MSEMDPYIEANLFPMPMLELKLLNKYKEGIIQILTERKKPQSNEVEKIPCYFQKNEKSTNILIIFHGNGSDIFNLTYYIKEISEKNNINILLVEYPGYSIYISPHSQEKIFEDSLIIYDFILNNMKNISDKNIFVLGRSLGSSVAIYLASKRKPAGVFLISPFTTFASVGNHDEEDKKILINFFRSIDYVENINSPLLFIHGKCDYLVNYEESFKLYEKCNKNIKKEIILKEGMGHNFLYEFLRDEIIPTINNFANKYCFKDEDNNSKDIIIDIEKKFFMSNEEFNNILNYFEKKYKEIKYN